MLIIGGLHELKGEGGGDHRDKIRSFELYRRGLSGVEVVTYDEVLARAEWVVASAGNDTSTPNDDEAW